MIEHTEVEKEIMADSEARARALGERDHLLEKTNELYQTIFDRPEGDGPFFAATEEERAALKKLYELLRTEL
jgi:hypothetical protein